MKWIFEPAAPVQWRHSMAALADSGLVVDGQLVIDRLGRTNDPFVLAGGPATTYQRKLGAADMDHQHCSSLEIGRKVRQERPISYPGTQQIHPCCSSVWCYSMKRDADDSQISTVRIKTT